MRSGNLIFTPVIRDVFSLSTETGERVGVRGWWSQETFLNRQHSIVEDTPLKNGAVENYRKLVECGVITT